MLFFFSCFVSDGHGGAIFMADGMLTLSLCNFSNNLSTFSSTGLRGLGGAIGITGGSSWIYGVTFSSNRCLSVSTSTSLGGAIYFSGGTLVFGAYIDGTSIVGNSFTDNSAYVIFPINRILLNFE